LVSIAAATLLVLLNLVTGIVSGSLGLVSAGIESSGDVVVAVLTFFATRTHATKPRAKRMVRGKVSVTITGNRPCMGWLKRRTVSTLNV
jgi:predicted Co/Zn/Cd cation transporter (cation efflux family)